MCYSKLYQRRASKCEKLRKSPGRDRSIPLRPDWEQVKHDIMGKAVLRKFDTHGDIRE